MSMSAVLKFLKGVGKKLGSIFILPILHKCFFY
jgi:hypothetical protein